MPSLDRRITLTVDTGGTRRQGEYIPNNVTLNVWARRTDTQADTLLETGGARGTVRRTYQIRYDPRVVAAFEAGRAVTVADPDSALATKIVTITEPDNTRRAWLDITVEGASP